MKKNILLFMATMVLGLTSWAQSASVDFSGTDIETRGQVQLTANGSQRTVELSSDFQTQEGPNLHVYLATDTTATDFTDLGALTSLSGKQSYEIPEEVKVEEQPMVLIYCQKFSHLFGYAKLPTPDYDSSRR